MIRFEPASKWFDNKNTTKKETLIEICYNSFNKTLLEIDSFNSNEQEWQNFRGTDINHIAKIPGMGRINLQTSGGADIINATRLNEGPSWRLTVEMDTNNKRAYGIYPGGQSGYPGSIHYDKYVSDWAEEKIYMLPFGKTSDEIEGLHLKCK